MLSIPTLMQRMMMKPEALFRCEPDEKMIGHIVSEFGSEMLLYASDYPHWDMTWPESAVRIWERQDIPLDAKRNILENNARRFYNIA
jgi:predicted TIM-barrel fold metal-dependent hydrolase